MKTCKRRGRLATTPSVPNKSVVKDNPIQAIMVSVQTPDMSDLDIERSNRELTMLVTDLGWQVIETVRQKRDIKTFPSYLGEGRLKEIAKLTGGSGVVAKGPTRVDLQTSGLKVVVDDELSPGQQRNLQSALGVEIIDRIAVILKVFEARARTKEAILQVELARLEYQLPRVKDDHSLGDKEGGGGRASRGHTNVELSKQRIRKNIASLKKEIQKLTSIEELPHPFTAALIGYTNSGKSTIMKALTGESIYVEDRLFATLGTTTREMSPPSVPPIFLADTVGFIERLPHQLLASFKSTLFEAKQAWILIQVVDASDPDRQNHITVTSQILKEINQSSSPKILVFNKSDRITEAERIQLEQEYSDAIFTNALSSPDMLRLREVIRNKQEEDLIEEQFVIGYPDYETLTKHRKYLEVVSEEFDTDIKITLKSTKKHLNIFKSDLTKKRK